MQLVSVAGSADDLNALGHDIRLIDSRAEVDDSGQWTVVGYADDDTFNQLGAADMAVTVIDDSDTVAADLAAVLDDIADDD